MSPSPHHRNYGSHFEKSKTAFEEGGGRGDLAENDESHPSSNTGSRPTSLQIVDEKRSTPEPA